MKFNEIEKRDIEIRFIPIVCSAPLIYAQSHGFFEKNGLNISLKRAPGWSAIKELLVREKIDAAHVLTPMPIASTIGIDGYQSDLKLVLIQNTNGQALTISLEHKGIKSVKDMKGFTFGVPFRFSMHYYLLCYFLAYHGINPLEDVTIIEVSPPIMPYYLKKGLVDGVFAPEPFNQIPVFQGTSFIHTLSKDIWPGHPCCSFATTRKFVNDYPNTYKLMLKSILEAQWTLHRSTSEEKKLIAQEISAKEYLNQPDYWIPVMQVLTGDFPNGLGNKFKIPDRIDFIPFPRTEYGIWILSQMQRWKQLRRVVNYKDIVESVFVSDIFKIGAKFGFKDRPRDDTSCHLMGDTLETNNAFEYMQNQPFSSFEKEPKKLTEYQDVDKIKKRLDEIADTMAEVAGGNLEKSIEITSDDEIGILEQIIGETVLNLKFTQLALTEDIEKRIIAEAQLHEEMKKSKKMENELLRKERLGILGTLAGGIAHEIRNPLGIIKNSVYFLKLKLRKYENDTILRHLNIISNEIDRSNKIITDLLSFTRVKTPEREEFSTNFLIEDILNKITLPDEKIEMDVILQSELPMVTADQIQISQVLYNLIINAIEAMPEGGKLEIIAGVKDNDIFIQVKDTGVGIPEENENKIFTPLFTTKGNKGIGLGLALSKTLIELNDGTITFDSVVNQGTTFTITIPFIPTSN